MHHSNFEAFNARDLAPTDVALSFVPSSKYDELVGANHSLLIGPRGSGKTTLLKMLSLEALRSWQHVDAENYRRRVNYTGIFVPADITWGEMVDALAPRDRVPEDCRQTLGEIAFGINVMLAATDVMALRIEPVARNGHSESTFRQVPPPKEIEELIETIASSWRLSLRSLSFRGIALALRARLADLAAAAKRISHALSPDMALLQKEIPYADLDVFVSLVTVLDAFNRYAGEANGRWALLLDELEVVPVHIQAKVIASLRASDARLIFKVALAPCGPQTELLLSQTKPSPLDDAKRIELWYRDKNEAIGFCRKLYDSRARHHTTLVGKQLAPEEMLGASLSEEPPVNGGKLPDMFPSQAASSWARDWEPYFTSLAKSDESFRAFLTKHTIDASDLRPSPSEANGNRIRKIAPIVAIRNAYRRSSGKKRGRKKFREPYLGWQAIATISEGNPRWFIGMLSGLERSLAEQGGTVPIEPAKQWATISRAMGAFLEKLKTVAIENNIGITTQQPVYRLLETIGTRFHNALVIEDFIEDPPASFVVDEGVSKDIENCLRIALNFGGIVCLDPPDNLAGYRSLRGKEFRLAYILAPEFDLPLRSSGKNRNLSSLLRTPAVAPVTPDSDIQTSLPL
jgi:energy-coupling factor transporter ATP-binding protein EcfA2